MRVRVVGVETDYWTPLAYIDNRDTARHIRLSARPEAAECQIKVAAALNAALGGGPTPTMVALEARINAFDVVHVTDFIMICMHATLLFGVVEFLFDEVEPKAIVRQFELVHTRTRTWVCRKTDTLLLVQVGCIECSLWWAGDADNVRVIKPDFMQIRTG